MNPPNNVIHVSPRRYRVNYKGLHGWVEYHPVSKTWEFVIKLQYVQVHRGETPSEAEAVLEIKRAIEIAVGGGAPPRSVD